VLFLKVVLRTWKQHGQAMESNSCFERVLSSSDVNAIRCLSGGGFHNGEKV